MKVLSLFLVLALAKFVTLIGREVPHSLWSIPAYLWQDALVAFLFGLVELVAPRGHRALWVAYGLVVFYSALNVPLVRVLFSPLTWQMSRAARGTLSGSISHYLTFETFACVGLILGAGVVLPLVLRDVPHRAKRASLGALLLLLFVGPIVPARVETDGLERNALVAFVSSALPRIEASVSDRDWRVSASPAELDADLARLRGAGAGRNVVLILLESTGARYLRPYGAAEDPMPNLSRLAGQSLLFENAYAVYPESIKGLFSVLCSRYPAFDTAPERYEQVTTPSIARLLSAAGYRTALFHSGRFAYLGMESIIQNRGYEALEDAGAIGGNVQSSFGVDEPATVKRMLAWIDGRPREEKFFITYLPIAGHHPYDSPEPRPFAGRDDRTHYLNALHYGDEALGNFLEGLERRGLKTNTLFVIFGDHGEAFGQHQGNYGHTLFIHDENVHVPYLIAAPGLFRETVRVSRVASLIDTAPTILGLLGLPAPADYQGTSLLEGGDRMALFYTDYSLGFLGLRDNSWKFIHQMESGRSKLFDLRRDPGEGKNLAVQNRERVAFYRRRLEQWSAAQKALFLAPAQLARTEGR